MASSGRGIYWHPQVLSNWLSGSFAAVATIVGAAGRTRPIVAASMNGVSTVAGVPTRVRSAAGDVAGVAAFVGDATVTQEE